VTLTHCDATIILDVVEREGSVEEGGHRIAP
jgi:hypothetical protein